MKSHEAAESRIRSVYRRRRDNPELLRLESYLNAGNLFLFQQRERQVLRLLESNYGFDLGAVKILDVGCGTGYWIRDFIKWGVRPENLCGIDMLEDSVAEARQRCPETVRIECGSAAQMPFTDGSFDLALQSVVFTSILDSDLKRQIASEMLRVIRVGGLVLWYDFTVNNPSNPDVAGVKKREIHALFPGCQIELERVTLAPPIARMLAPISWMACHLLDRIPFLCTHYLGAIRKQ